MSNANRNDFPSTT